MEPGAGFRAGLLRQQVDDVELLEGRKHRDNDSRGNDGAHGGDGNVLCPGKDARAVQNGAFVVAFVDALQGSVHNHDHEGQRQPQIDHRAAQKRRHVGRKPPDRPKPQLVHPLIQQAELGVEHPGFPEQNPHISGHRPGKHQHRFVKLAQPELFDIQKVRQQKGDDQLQNHADDRPKDRCQQCGQEAGIEHEQRPDVVIQSHQSEVKPVVDIHIGQADIEGVENGKYHHQPDQQQGGR